MFCRGYPDRFGNLYMLLDSRYRGVFVRKKQCMATMLLETVYFRKLYSYRMEM